MPSVLRIIDANANRAREALRVMEEAARFILNEAELSGAIKRLRHDLAAALSIVPNLEAHRDTPGDVGTRITTAAERSRGSIADVAVAAGKRLSEALRAIEEYGKTLPAEQAAALAEVEPLRYRGYALEQQLNTALSCGRARQWKLCLLLTESLCRLPWRDVLEQALDAGTDCVQLREKEIDGGELLERAALVVECCHAHGAAVIVNDRPDVALLAGADGVHVGQADLRVADVRKLAGGQLLIGVSTSNRDQARGAQQAGADYVGVGPMFPTATKHKPVLAGPEYLRTFLADDQLRDLPHLAIGGIDPENLPELVDVGVRGVAVSSVVCGADRPGEVCEGLLQSWGE
ncbi:MAG: thiamine phosphate synthase [Planctomycetota bacterium]